MEKKILFISNIPSPYNVEYLNELGKLADVTAVFERWFSAERDGSWKELNVVNFSCHILSGIKITTDSAFSPNVIRFIHRYKHEHIIIGNPATATGIMAILYCKLFSIPFILQSEGGIPKDGKGLKEGIKKWLMKSAVLYLSGMNPAHDYFLAYGATQDQIIQYPFTSLYENDLVKYVPTADIKKELRKKLGIEANTMIISVGQFTHRKGFDILLKACKDLSHECFVLIIGGDPIEDYLSIIKKYELKNIHFLPFIKRAELTKYYEAADIFVLPTREDTWGLVINEAMAAGLPVITTDRCVAGCELIKDGVNGYLVSADDVEMIHRKMNELIASPEKCYSMGIKSREIINEYTYENMAKVIFDGLSGRDIKCGK